MDEGHAEETSTKAAKDWTGQQWAVVSCPASSLHRLFQFSLCVCVWRHFRLAGRKELPDGVTCAWKMWNDSRHHRKSCRATTVVSGTRAKRRPTESRPVNWWASILTLRRASSCRATCSSRCWPPSAICWWSWPSFAIRSCGRRPITLWWRWPCPT